MNPQKTHRDPALFGALLALALSAAALAGCTGGADGPGPQGIAEGPAFLLGTRVWDDNDTTSFFHLIPSLEAGTPLDRSIVLEVPGAAKLFSARGIGWFAVGQGEAPTITRYTLDETGALLEGDSINLGGYGVKGLWDTLYFVSPTKAYYPDRAGEQLIVWNPQAMKVEGTIELPQTARAGYLAIYGYAPILRGKHLLFSVGYFDWEETDTVLPETGLVTIDTELDALADFETDSRCGGVTQPIFTPEGDAYLISSALAGAAFRLGRLSTEPCALRIRKDERSFDPDYEQKLGALTAGAVAGEPVPGANGGVFLRVFDESLAQVDDDFATYELTGQAAWRWARFVPGTDELTVLDGLEPSTSDVLWFQIDDRVYGTETTADYSETTLLELTAEGGPRRALTAPGFLHNAARIR